MKATRIMSALSFGLLAVPAIFGAQAQEAEWSGNVAISTDYVWRGISQSNGDLAISGGFDVAAGSFYAGTWASNVDFGDDTDTNVEVDVYAGFSSALANGITWDVGAIYYAYPDSSDTDLDFFEVYGGLGYEFKGGLALGGQVSWDPDNQNVYSEATAGFALSETFGVDASVGNYNFDGGSDYTGWSLGGTLAFTGFELDVRYWDTDIDGTSIADERVVLSLSRAM